jgi:hypothetical protein
VGGRRWRASDSRTWLEEVGGQVPLVPGRAAVWVAAHDDTAVWEEDRSGVIAPHVLHVRAELKTGSRMDEVIFEEFKGTGNSEIILDRKVADKRTYPAIDITRSGTRKEELLVAPDILKKMYVLRRILNPMGTIDGIEFLLGKLRETPKGNATFFESMNT